MKRAFLLLCAALLLLTGCSTPPAEASGTSETSSTESEPPTDENEYTKKAKEAAQAVYPQLKSYTPYDYSLDLSAVNLIDDGAAPAAMNALRELLAERGSRIEAGAGVTITLGGGAENAPEGENYRIDCTQDTVVLSAKDASGQFYAVKTLGALLGEGSTLYALCVEDGPTVPYRGIVEGFYGTPWSHEDRLSMIEFCGDVRMNTYIYAPKDDSKHRDQWRELYDDAEEAKLTELIHACAENNVRFVYALSPGLDFRFTADGYEADFEALMAKYDSLYRLGVRDFALLLDDLPDRTAQAAANHARLVNEFREAFYANHEGLSELLTIFAEYFDGYITADYTYTLARRLNDDVEVMWTGPDVSLINLNAASMEQPNRLYGRKMFFWWNYPVNDYCVDRLLVDRVTGLAADLPEAISGFVSNPMNQAEASKLPLFTLADYLWNPQSYDRAQSYDAAFRSLYGDLAEDMRLFCDTICAGYINNYTDSLRFQTLVSRFSAGNDAVCAELKALFTALKEAAAAIRENDTTGFAAETEPWLKKAELYGEMGELLMTLAEGAETMDDAEFWSLCTRILELREQTDASSAIVSGKVLTPLFADFEALVTARRELIPAPAFAAGSLQTTLSAYGTNTPDKATDGSLQTYFWSAAAPKADGSDSFTLTLNEPTAVRNLYLAMGADETDGDRLTGYTLEYSSDGETWTAFHTAVNGDTLYLQGLDFEARYIRLANLRGNTWIALRELEVNTARPSTNVDAHAEQATISSTQGCYQAGYEIENALTYGSDRYYWSEGAAAPGFAVTLDLGKITDVRSLIYESGVGATTEDYIRSGVMEYSTDGVNWETVGTYSTRNIYLHDLNLRCRYLRYVSQSEQDYWLSLAHFAVNEELTCDSIAVTAPGRAQHEAFRLLDGSFTTSYRATVKAGDTIAVDCGGISVSEITLLASSLPAARLSLVSDGATVELGALSEPFGRISPETPTEAEKLLLTFTEDGLADIQEIFFS